MAHPAITVLVDGACPLCRREADLMMRLDGGRGRLAIVDIAAPGFDPALYGRTIAELMGTIHGVVGPGPGATDGARPELVTGMEVFRRAYGAVGWGWLLAPTGWPVLRPLFDWLYTVFARHRLRLTGRAACAGGSCGG
jgi:predicted DCC family thiol-disulfide oxidoreductase YuxK